jgi:hypothetical protein
MTLNNLNSLYGIYLYPIGFRSRWGLLVHRAQSLLLAAFLPLLLLLFFYHATRHSELVVFLVVLGHAPLADNQAGLLLFEFIKHGVCNRRHTVKVPESESWQLLHAIFKRVIG